MESALVWQDYTVIIAYLVGMIALGAYLSRRQSSDDDYFLAGRSMPWFAVGISVIASLLSSLTYLGEPGEVWNSGITHLTGKMLAIPFEMIFVWVFCVPFLMRFRFTSAYEYLEYRYGSGTRLLGVVLFLVMVVLWMGFIVLVSSRVLAQVSGLPLLAVIVTVGVVATVYTMLGGLRAVIWTDVVQVALLVGGGLFTIGYVAWATGTWIPEWYGSAIDQLRESQSAGGTAHDSVPFFSFNPFVRMTVVTAAMHMFCWHVCTHVANQMTVQRYYSTADTKAARRSFITGSLVGVGINIMLVTVGLAMIYYYYGQGVPLDSNLDASISSNRGMIFPTFAVHRLPPGMGGGILAALLAAAMSSIDSGVNSIATVISVEVRRWQRDQSEAQQKKSHIPMARVITLLVGLFVSAAAYALHFISGDRGIIEAMPRTFNAITGPIGGLFLVGMFLPFVKARAVVLASFCGLLMSLCLGYSKEICGVLMNITLDHFQELSGVQFDLGFLHVLLPSISLTWIMPGSLSTVFVTAIFFSLFDRSQGKNLAGLTWFTRNQTSPETTDILK